MSKKIRSKGFTLIEMSIVVMALGMFALVISKFISPSEEEVKTKQSFLPDDFSELVDIDIVYDLDYRFVTYINTSGDIMTATYKSNGNLWRKEVWMKPEKH